VREIFTYGSVGRAPRKRCLYPGKKLFLQMNEKNLHSDMVKQDVLILTVRNDHFIPFRAHDMQIKALTNAKSVTGRVFTKEEQAHNHCQIGNTGLAHEVMGKWIDEKSCPPVIDQA